MPSIIIDIPLKKKFEGIRGKFLSTGLFESITRAETLELMIDVLNALNDPDEKPTSPERTNLNMVISVNDKGSYYVNPFNSGFIRDLLEKRKEKT